MSFASAQVDFGGKGGVKTATHGNDSKLFVEFHLEQILQTAATDEKGEPVYQDVPYITITIPGDKKTEVIRPVKMQTDLAGKSDLERWPAQWERFQSGLKQLSEGDPIENLVINNVKIGRSEVRQLTMMNILTIQHLAELPDYLLDDVGLGARGLRESARKWLIENNDSKKELEKVRAENETMKSQLEILQTQMAELMSEKAEKGKPGRKPKVEETVE